MTPTYLYLSSGSVLPSIKLQEPFMAVVIIESDVDPDWRALVSEWLVESGCLFMMAWGKECALWDDSVDLANLKKFGSEEIPDDNFVRTTWHNDEVLEEVFWFSQHAAQHVAIDEKRLLLVDISTKPRSDSIIAEFKNACDLHVRDPY